MVDTAAPTTYYNEVEFDHVRHFSIYRPACTPRGRTSPSASRLRSPNRNPTFPFPPPPPPRFVPPCLSLQPLPPDPDLDPDLDLDLDLVSLARDLERFSTHESIRAILDQGADAADTTREIEQHLHEAEMTMVDQYIAAAGDLEDLHGQVTYADDGLGQTLTP